MHFQVYRARETELIEACRRNDRTAQKALFERMAPRMLSVCRRYVRDRMEAEDVLVMSFTKIFERIGQYKGEGSFEGWVRRIVVNESLTFLRKNKMMYLETDLVTAERESGPALQETGLEAEDLLRLIQELPAGYRMVFNLYAIDGFSHKEIAEQMGITESTSKSQLSRARTHLQARLQQSEQDRSHKQQAQ
jgi:RNA polymerase sigma-70 factor (ECF subfamily)